MSRIFRLVFVATLLTIIAGCSGSVARETEVDVPPDESVGLGADANGGHNLTINKSSLGEEYLLQGMQSFQRDYGTTLTNPTASSLKSKIVVFSEHDGEILMIESSKGYIPGDELDSEVLLAKFPIIENREDEIVFDFNLGIRYIFSSWDWYASDFSRDGIQPNEVYFVENSFIRNIEGDAESVIVDQNISVREGSILQSIEVKYYLTKYAPNPNFTPVLTPGFDYLGYLEANPLVQEDFGNTFNYISRWDISKPVTYYISSDTPEKYRQAMIEGVLYWNRAFGAEVLRAEVAPEGVKAPSFEHNMIQWHTSHNYGTSYATAQIDPRTGEILHAQVYISSGAVSWADGWYLRFFERQLSEAGIDFDACENCNVPPEEIAKDFYLYRDALSELSAERIDVVVNDLLRWLIAHEVGHTLGLRHNFAASQISEWGGEELDSVFREYLESGELPEGSNLPMNSVMEYPDIADYVIAGAMMKNPDAPAFPHDEYAIQWGYYGYFTPPEYKNHPFCTDSHVGIYTDCQKNDGGRHLIERKAYKVRRAFEKTPWMLSEIYLFSKISFDPLDRRPVRDQKPSARGLAAKVAIEWLGLSQLLGGGLRLRSVDLNYADPAGTDAEAVEDDVLKWLEYEISYAGGIGEIFAVINPDYYQKTVDGYPGEFKRIVSSETFNSVSLPEGGTASFTDDEKNYMIERAAELFPETDTMIVEYVNLILSKTNLKLVDAAERQEEAIARWVEYVLTAWNGSNLRYRIDTRQRALMFLAKNGPLPGWMKSHIPNMVEKLEERLIEMFGMPLGDVRPENFPRRDQAAAAAELDIYYKLISMSAGAPIPEPKVPISNPNKEDSGAVSWIGKLLN